MAVQGIDYPRLKDNSSSPIAVNLTVSEFNHWASDIIVEAIKNGDTHAEAFAILAGISKANEEQVRKGTLRALEFIFESWTSNWMGIAPLDRASLPSRALISFAQAVGVYGFPDLLEEKRENTCPPKRPEPSYGSPFLTDKIESKETLVKDLCRRYLKISGIHAAREDNIRFILGAFDASPVLKRTVTRSKLRSALKPRESRRSIEDAIRCLECITLGALGFPRPSGDINTAALFANELKNVHSASASWVELIEFINAHLNAKSCDYKKADLVFKQAFSWLITTQPQLIQ